MTKVYDFFGNAVALTPDATTILTTANLVGNTLTGTTGNDAFKLDSKGGHILIGNGGNDSFYGVTASDTIVEPASSTGVNTATVNGNYVMGAALDNLVVGWAPGGVWGNSKENYIVSQCANITIDGGGGNDVFTGTTGDTFRFDAGSGFDVITNFAPGARTSIQANPETVQLAGYAQFQSFAQVKAAMTQHGGDVVLQLDANDAIKFLNTTIGQFSADNFLLANAPATKTLRMTFDDEFDGTSLSASTGGLDTLWRTDYGWGNDNNAAFAHTLPTNGEQELYVDPTMVSTVTGQTVPIDPFSLKNGNLVIHAAPTPANQLTALSGYKFTSGMLSTRDSFTQTYGYFEAKMQLPAAAGAWPAFWLYSATGDKAEIDIMESHGNQTWTATTHDYGTGSHVAADSAIFTPDLTTKAHVFGLLWTASTITWFLDGVAVRSIATPADMNQPMYMVLDLALDSTTSSNFAGANLNVSYVRAYSLNNLPASVVTASGSNETLNDLNGATTLVGGTGNATFEVTRATTQVIDNDASANTVVHASVNYTLPANIAKLILEGNATIATSNAHGGTLVANALGDTLIAGSGSDTLIGGAGNDTLVAGSGRVVMTGGGGNNVFRFGSVVKNDDITDYNPAHDRLDLGALSGHAFSLVGTNGGTMLTFAGDGQIFFDHLSPQALVGSSGFAVAALHASGTSWTGTV